MSDDVLTVGDAAATELAMRLATALFQLVTGRKPEHALAEASRDDALRLLAGSGVAVAGATLVIELVRGTPLRDDPAWVAEVVRTVDADPRLAGVGERLTRRFIDGAPPGEAPMFTPAMVEALLDAEAANLADLDRDLPGLVARVARALAALR